MASDEPQLDVEETLDVLLVLRPGRDPLERPGCPSRDPDYRLKLVLKRLLRDFGFKCLRVCDLPSGTPPATVGPNAVPATVPRGTDEARGEPPA